MMKAIPMSLGLLFLTYIGSAQVNITIDKSKQYQVIEGFGGLAQESYDWSPTKTLCDKFADDMVNDLGCTIFRHIIDGGLEPANDNANHNNTDFSKFNMGFESGCKSNAHMALTPLIGTMKKLKNLVEKNGEKCQFYTTVFSPPYWMKYVKCVSGTDFLWNRMATAEEETAKGGTDGVDGVKDFKDEFAEFCYAYLQTMKNNGVVVDAFSIQNEPVFPQSYSSCVYSPESYFATFKTVGQYIRNKGFKTRMMFTEDIGDLSRYNQFVRPITVDPITASFADIAAVHSYSANAVSPGSNDARLWDNLNKVSRQRNAARAFWQTETSGYSNDYNGAISLSIAIYTGLKYGKVNAWMFHGLSHPTEVEGLVLNGGIKTDRYYAAKHFFKYVRPEAISVDAVSSDPSVLSTAFQHNGKRTLTVVLINSDATNAKKISLKTIQGNGNPTSYKMYLTRNSSTRCADQGNVLSNAIIDMPANSIITLVGENSFPETPTSSEEAIAENQLDVQVYPNPSQGGFYIQSNIISGASTEIVLLDLNGREVLKTTYHQNGSELYLNTSGLPNGLYTLKYDNQYRKVVINK